jgi:hypothetical protein
MLSLPLRDTGSVAGAVRPGWARPDAASSDEMT